MLLEPAFRALNTVIRSCLTKSLSNQTSSSLLVSFKLTNLKRSLYQIQFDALIRPANWTKPHFRTLSTDMAPKTSKGRKTKADKAENAEEASKATRSKRGQSNKSREVESKAVSKKSKPADSSEEEVMDTNSVESCSDNDSGSETSDKPVSPKKGGKGKEKSAGKNVAKEHAISDDNDSEAETSETSKPISRPPKKRGPKAAPETSDEPSSKKSKTDDGNGDSKPKLNQTSSNYKDIKFDCDTETKDGKKWNFKISSWNVAGLKAWVKKDGLTFIKKENPDIICLQETKCAEKDLPPGSKVSGYHSYWLTGEKKGYAGVALLSKEKPLKVDYGIGNKDFDCDGRIITSEFDKFFLVAVYVPNAGQKLKNLDRRMEWDPLLRAHIKKLDEKKPVILCGDMNVSHNAIDLANPTTNTKSAGFSQQERDGMTVLLKEGFVDTFRHLYPEQKGAYTFWTYMGNARSRNTGWRLDYFILSERFVPSVCDNVIRNAVYGSDHCPITLFLHI